jgi:hypothetical protein
MAKPREDKEMEETRRIMERLVKMPPKPHEESRVGKKKEKSPKRQRRPVDSEADT